MDRGLHFPLPNFLLLIQLRPDRVHGHVPVDTLVFLGQVHCVPLCL
jgi:hypothetical protein